MITGKIKVSVSVINLGQTLNYPDLDYSRDHKKTHPITV